ncbi:MAG TPA: DNA methyltransferase [bacterium]|nr:DNA methyltransferase [bacterium]
MKKGDIVLDPFMGSGTTGAVAKRYERNFIGFELNKEYFEIAQKQINETEIIDDLFSSKYIKQTTITIDSSKIPFIL